MTSNQKTWCISGKTEHSRPLYDKTLDKCTVCVSVYNFPSVIEFSAFSSNSFITTFFILVCLRLSLSSRAFIDFPGFSCAYLMGWHKQMTFLSSSAQEVLDRIRHTPFLDRPPARQPYVLLSALLQNALTPSSIAEDILRAITGDPNTFIPNLERLTDYYYTTLLVPCISSLMF